MGLDLGIGVVGPTGKWDVWVLRGLAEGMRLEVVDTFGRRMRVRTVVIGGFMTFWFGLQRRHVGHSFSV